MFDLAVFAVGSARRLVALAGVCAALAASGCASSRAAAPPRPLILAALPAPRLGAGAVSGGASELTPEDFLLEVATQLSLEPRLDLCLVPGPLLAEGLPEASQADVLLGVVDGLGQIAAPVYVGLRAEEVGPGLLETLRQTLRQHPGRASAWGPPVLGWRPVALDSGGDLAALEAFTQRETAADEGDPGKAAEGPGVPLLVALGGSEPARDPRLYLQVRAGEAPGLSAAPGGGLVLTLPPLSSGLYALCTLDPSHLQVEWRSVAPETLAPPPPERRPWGR